MKDATPEEIGRKMDALGLWDAAMPCNWVVKPAGTAFPYFCTVLKDEGPLVKIRFMMLEGWQTFHDFVRTRVDRDFGFYSTPMELPHFELVVDATGGAHLFRHDPGYVPRALDEREKELCAKILWEAYGVMMRLESDAKLPMKYADERAMFARVESSPGTWSDAPMAISNPPPYVENVTFPKALLEKAKDLPFAKDEAIELDFRIMPNMMTREPRPRLAYQLAAFASGTGERVMMERCSVTRDVPLKALWENMPRRVLGNLVARGRVPGEIKVLSTRVFRMLRALCLELPFRLSLHDALPSYEEALKACAG